ncbi:MAG TPA: transposase [Burkholderiales bacterium]|nr:transposase [Burkholderiales bacterium]
MPRAARSVIVDCPLHIVQRGINRGPCFFGDADYATYLRYLAVFSARFGCSIHAYCLMTNHVHLLLTPHTMDACRLVMKNVNQLYVQRINHRLGRTGTLWEGRCHSSLVTSDRYVLACYRYIELNPVRAGIITTPAQYRWSSYRANAEGQERGFLKPHAVYEALGREPYKETCTAGLGEAELDEIRKAVRAGCAIGTPRRGRGRPSKLNEKNGVRPHFPG